MINAILIFIFVVLLALTALKGFRFFFPGDDAKAWDSLSVLFCPIFPLWVIFAITLLFVIMLRSP